jgi:hypothetical protein
MQNPESAIDSAIDGASRLRSLLSKGRTRQVQASDERADVKVMAMTWFKNLRPIIVADANPDLLSTADYGYRRLLEMGDRDTSRAGYLGHLRALREELIQIRSRLLVREWSNTRRAPKLRTARA